MKIRKNNYRGSFYPMIWLLIILVASYIIIRFTTIYILGDSGQANDKLSDTITSKLCASVIESGSSLLHYTVIEEEEAFSFPIKSMDKTFAMQKYSGDEILENPKTSLTMFDNNSINDNMSDYMKENTNENPVRFDESKITDEEIEFADVTKGHMPKEYILTNGGFFHSIHYSNGYLTYNIEGEDTFEDKDDILDVGVMEGDVYYDNTEDNEDEGDSIETVKTSIGATFTMEQLKNVNFLIRNFYIVDPDTSIVDSLFDSEKLLGKDMTLKQNNDKPQILIYHTHSKETYIDSKANEKSDTVVGVGTYLTKILEEKYGYNVIHDTSCYDVIDGKLDRNKAYNEAEDGINKILEKYPSIEVVIDLHRDGAPKRTTTIHGEETAQIMLFNGLSRNLSGPITYLDNPYLEDNLAFSLQLQLKSLSMYPGLFYRNYLHCYRYNMNVRPKCLLMELGTDKNTLQSAKNAMEPFAEVLDSILQGK